MNKFTMNFRKFLKIYLISFGISLFIGLTIFFIFFFVNSQSIVAALNGATVAFVVLLAAGALAFVARNGMFDSLSYGFSQLFTSMFSKKANKYNDFNAYKDEKAQKRTSSPNIYLAVLLASLIFGIATLVLFIIIKSKNMY